MKKIYTLALGFLSLTVLSQVPMAINYQGVARNANGSPIVGTIGVSITIHVGSPTGPATLTEQHHPNTNQFGIFDIRIGSNTTGGLGNIAWGTNTYYLGVAIDPSGGSNYGAEITNQQFVSVPYALYAEKAGNAGGSTTVTSTSDAITVAGTNPSFTIAYQPPILVLLNDTVLSIKQGTYNSTPVILKGGGASATATPLGPWTANSGSVQLLNAGDRVGVGAVPVYAKLDVISTTTTGLFVASPASGILAVTTATNSSFAAITGNNQGGNPSGPGVMGVSSSSLGAGVNGLNSGNGPGVYGTHSNNSNSPNSHGVVGDTWSTAGTAAGVLGLNNGAGPGVYGWQGPANGGPGVWGVSNSSISPGVYGMNSNPNNANAGVIGEITSGSNSSAANGVIGRTNSTNSLVSGVYGQNTGAGHGVYGLSSANGFLSYGVFGKNVGLGEGVRGEANTTSNIVAAVSASNSGAGPALKGSLPAGTSAGFSNAALLIENGHIWATQVNAPTLAIMTNSTGATISGVSVVPGSNDVRGMITVTVQASTATWNVGGYLDVNLTFNKQYSTGGPWVTLGKYDQTPFEYEIQNMFTTNVVFRLRNPAPAPTAPNITVLKFNYIVMQ
jgi:hypothetical protein